MVQCHVTSRFERRPGEVGAVWKIPSEAGVIHIQTMSRASYPTNRKSATDLPSGVIHLTETKTNG
jgi:hypothetical protein